MLSSKDMDGSFFMDLESPDIRINVCRFILPLWAERSGAISEK